MVEHQRGDPASYMGAGSAGEEDEKVTKEAAENGPDIPGPLIESSAARPGRTFLSLSASSIAVDGLPHGDNSIFTNIWSMN